MCVVCTVTGAHFERAVSIGEAVSEIRFFVSSLEIRKFGVRYSRKIESSIQKDAESVFHFTDNKSFSFFFFHLSFPLYIFLLKSFTDMISSDKRSNLPLDSSIWFDSTGNIYFIRSEKVRKYEPWKKKSSTIITLPMTGLFNDFYSLWGDSVGRLYIADSSNHLIRTLNLNDPIVNKNH